MLAFLTVQSNELVGVTSAWLALRPEPGGTTQRSLRLTAPVGILMTEIVFPRAAPAAGVQGAATFAHLLPHTVWAEGCVSGWLAVGPARHHRPAHRGGGALVFPVAWLVTLVGGAAIGFWPHPSLGADDFGFGVPLST